MQLVHAIARNARLGGSLKRPALPSVRCASQGNSLRILAAARVPFVPKGPMRNSMDEMRVRSAQEELLYLASATQSAPRAAKESFPRRVPLDVHIASLDLSRWLQDRASARSVIQARFGGTRLHFPSARIVIQAVSPRSRQVVNVQIASR